jgi:hypothetical protein
MNLEDINKDDIFYKEKYIKYKKKYIRLKNKLKEQQGGVIYPGIYLIFFADPDNKFSINGKKLNANGIFYDIDNFPSFYTFGNIFGINTYSIQNDNNNLSQIDMYGIFTKYFVKLMSAANISKITEKIIEYGTNIDVKSVQILMSHLYFNTENNIKINLDVKRSSIYRTIDKTKFPETFKINEPTIIKIINGLNNKINEIICNEEIGRKLINSVAVVDIGLKTNNLIYMKRFNDTIKPSKKGECKININTNHIKENIINKDASLKKKVGGRINLDNKIGGFVGIETICIIVAFMLLEYIAQMILTKSIEVVNNIIIDKTRNKIDNQYAKDKEPKVMNLLLELYEKESIINVDAAIEALIKKKMTNNIKIDKTKEYMDKQYSNDKEHRDRVINFSELYKKENIINVDTLIKTSSKKNKVENNINIDKQYTKDKEPRVMDSSEVFKKNPNYV